MAALHIGPVYLRWRATRPVFTALALTAPIIALRTTAPRTGPLRGKKKDGPLRLSFCLKNVRQDPSEHVPHRLVRVVLDIVELFVGHIVPVDTTTPFIVVPEPERFLVSPVREVRIDEKSRHDPIRQLVDQFLLRLRPTMDLYRLL